MRGVGLFVGLLAACTRPSSGYGNCDPVHLTCNTLDAGGTSGSNSSGTNGTNGTNGSGTNGGTHDLGTTVTNGTNGTGGADMSMSSGGLPTGATCSSSGSDCVSGDVCALSHGVRDVDICRQSCHLDGDCQQSTFPGGLAPFCEGGTCSISCNPTGAAVGTNGCGPGLACYALDDKTRSTSGVTVITDCVPPGAGLETADCSTNGTIDCAPGYVCVHIILSICKVACDLTATTNPCPAGENCTAFLNTSSQYGYCY